MLILSYLDLFFVYCDFPILFPVKTARKILWKKIIETLSILPYVNYGILARLIQIWAENLKDCYFSHLNRLKLVLISLFILLFSVLKTLELLTLFVGARICLNLLFYQRIDALIFQIHDCCDQQQLTFYFRVEVLHKFAYINLFESVIYLFY